MLDVSCSSLQDIESRLTATCDLGVEEFCLVQPHLDKKDKTSDPVVECDLARALSYLERLHDPEAQHAVLFKRLKALLSFTCGKKQCLAELYIVAPVAQKLCQLFCEKLCRIMLAKVEQHKRCCFLGYLVALESCDDGPQS